MKDKILSALKTKYTNLGFGEKAFDGVADYLSKTVTEETQIETSIPGVEPLLKAFQSEIDSRVSSAVEKAKKENKKPEGGQQKQPETPADDTPAWFKQFAEKIESKLSAIEGQQVVKTRQQTLSEKLKEAPDAYKSKILKDFARMTFESEDDFNAYLSETEAYVKQIIQESANDSLGVFGKPPRGGQSSSSNVKSDIENWAKSKVAQENHFSQQQKKS